MNTNVGGIDRIVRIVVGIALIVWALAGGPLWAWIGIVPLATALFKFCPLYTLFGFSSCAVKKSEGS